MDYSIFRQEAIVADSVKSLGASDFFVRLREEVEAQELTQGQLAERVTAAGYPMKQPRVSELLKGAPSRLPLEEVEALARALRVPAGWLAFKEGKRSAGRKALTDEVESVPLPRPVRKKKGA